MGAKETKKKKKMKCEDTKENESDTQHRWIGG